MSTYITILVVGVSGVGKTTACKQLVVRQPTFVHMSASQILADATGLTSEQLRTSTEYDIVSRQKAIESFVAEFKESNPARSLIIDGHTVIDNGASYVNVPLSTIRSISPTLIVHLSQDPDILLSRRHADNRHRPLRSPAELCQYQRLSEERASYFAKSLNVPCYVARELDDVEVMQASSKEEGKAGSVRI